MTFNPPKCKVMHMSRKKVCSSAPLQYYLNDKPLESVTHISDLGATVSKDLSWAKHIEDICTKANKTLGLIKRVCARDVVDANTRKLLYCAVVRPKLEYASGVWSPYSAKQRKLIENVQRRATKFILNYPPRDVTYRDRLISLTFSHLNKNQEFFRKSYFPRTVILWNNPPPNIKAAHSLQTFKQHLHTYYKAKLFTHTPP